MQKLIFFVGAAGTGKTTIARKVSESLPAAFLDRDTIGGRFVEAILEMNGLEKNDRDSDFYRRHLRDLDYDATKDVCIENLAAGQNVFMISPFTAELKSNQWLEDLIKAAGLSRREVDVKVVIVTLQDVKLQKERIISRQTIRDQWKIDNWNEFEKRIGSLPEINWDLPSSSILHFDNSGSLTDEKAEQLRRFVAG